MTLTPADLEQLRAHLTESAEAVTTIQAALMRERATVASLRRRVAALTAVVEQQAEALEHATDRRPS